MARTPKMTRTSKRGGVSVVLEGERELRKRVSYFTDIKFQADVMKELAPVAEDLAEAIRQASKAVGAPKDVQDSIFSYSKGSKFFTRRRTKYRLTGLVGVNRGYKSGGRTGPSYFEWVTTTNPGVVSRKGGGWSIVRKRNKGTTLGMSLASVYEYGTSNRYARPYFRPTVNAKIAMIRKGATEAMLKAIEAQDIRRKKVA